MRCWFRRLPAQSANRWCGKWDAKKRANLAVVDGFAANLALGGFHGEGTGKGNGSKPNQEAGQDSGINDKEAWTH
jgi:hypothetical protein